MDSSFKLIFSGIFHSDKKLANTILDRMQARPAPEPRSPAKPSVSCFKNFDRLLKGWLCTSSWTVLGDAYTQHCPS
jgi:hypothetical protein